MPQKIDRPGPCDAIREVLSARLDGEAALPEWTAADAHLTTCPDCRGWFDDAAAVTRLVRTRPAVAGPDVTRAVLPAAPGHGRSRVAGSLRGALAIIGVTQLVLTIARLSGAATADGHEHGGFIGGATMAHLGHESAAWSLGLAVGFLWVAARRSHPAAIAPVLTAFVGVVVLLNVGDLIAGQVGTGHVVTHTTELVGYLVVVALSRPSLNTPEPSPARARAGRSTETQPVGVSPSG